MASRNQHSFAKRKRELEKKRKAEEKRARKEARKDGNNPDEPQVDGETGEAVTSDPAEQPDEPAESEPERE